MSLTTGTYCIDDEELDEELEAKSYSELSVAAREKQVEATDVLREWMEERGAAFPSLDVQYYAVDYRGLHTNRDIKNNEVMMTIPPHLLITTEVVKESEIGRQITDADIGLCSSHSWVSCWLLEERRKGEASEWAAYMDTLPSNFGHMPVKFTAGQLNYLTGSFTLPEIYEKRQSYVSEYWRLARGLPDFQDRYTLDDFIWGRLMVLTRIFGLTIQGHKTSALVPMADMVNHKRPPESWWTFDDEKGSFTITAGKDFDAGEAITESYGRKCNSKFFVNYGFVAVDNLFNRCCVKVAIADDDPDFHLKVRLCGGAQKTHIFPEDPNSDECKMLLTQLRIKHATALELDILKEMKNTAHEAEKLGNLALAKVRAFNLANELRVLQGIRDACTETLAGFDCDVKTDDDLLASSEGLHRNVVNAIQMRRCEKIVAMNWIVRAETILSVFEDMTVLVAHCSEALLKSPAPALQDKHARNYLRNTILPLLLSEDLPPTATLEHFFAQMPPQARNLSLIRLRLSTWSKADNTDQLPTPNLRN